VAGDGCVRVNRATSAQHSQAAQQPECCQTAWSHCSFFINTTSSAPQSCCGVTAAHQLPLTEGLPAQMHQRVHCWGCPVARRQLADRWHLQHLQMQHTTQKHETAMHRRIHMCKRCSLKLGRGEATVHDRSLPRHSTAAGLLSAMHTGCTHMHLCQQPHTSALRQ
jgi:hypothetical protein